MGDFFLDIVAEDDDGKQVIIENQLEKTDGCHLGKLLTYLTNLEAKTAIWIASQPREEHIKAINWLNESTPPDISFYLVKIEAIKIEDCPQSAPLFSVIVEPSETIKEIGKEKKEYAERHLLRKEFWTQLLEKAKEKNDLHAHVSPSVENWISAGAGKAGMVFSYVITNDNASAELYLDRGKEFPELNKVRFDELFKHREQIEKSFGDKLSWERLDGKRASRIAFRIKEIGLKDKARWVDLQEQMIHAMTRLEKALEPYIKTLK